MARTNGPRTKRCSAATRSGRLAKAKQLSAGDRRRAGRAANALVEAAREA